MSDGLVYGIEGMFIWLLGTEFRFLFVKRESPPSIKITKKWNLLLFEKVKSTLLEVSGHLLEILFSSSSLKWRIELDNL